MATNISKRLPKFPQYLASACKVVKLVTCIACLMGFMFTTYKIFDQYAEGATLLSSDLYSSPNGKLTFPAVVICNSVAYNKRKLSSNLSDYVDNTLKLKDFFTSGYFFKVESDGSLSVMGIDQPFRAIYTAFYGTCYSLNTRYEVGKFVKMFPFVHSLFLHLNK